MSESKLTKYFREQVEGTEQDINQITDAFIKSKGGTVNQNELLTHLKSQGFTAGQVLDFLDRRFGKALDPFKGRASSEKRASPIDKFENAFNPGVKCAHCGMSRSQHGKGMMDHPFETRKQNRDKFQSRLKQTENRADSLLRDFQRQFGADAPQDAEGALDFLRRNGVPRDEAVRAIQAMGGAIEAKEVKDEIEFWNTATSGQKRRIATMLDINQNARWEQLTPAEQGSLAVWWDEGGGSKSIGGSESAISNPKDFVHRKPLIKTKHIGQFPTKSPESFYNYDGNEKLDSRGEIKKPIGALSKKKISRLKSRMTPEEREDADEVFFQYERIPANEGLVNIETTGQLFHNVLAQLSALAPIQNFEIKAQFTDGKKGLIVLSFQKSKDQKMMVDILKGVMRTNGVTKVGSTEVFGSEGQKFTVTQDGTMLPKGNYEVLGKKTDQAHSGPWGTFSITTVKNLETGERHEIPTGNAQLIYGIN